MAMPGVTAFCKESEAGDKCGEGEGKEKPLREKLRQFLFPEKPTIFPPRKQRQSSFAGCVIATHGCRDRLRLLAIRKEKSGAEDGGEREATGCKDRSLIPELGQKSGDGRTDQKPKSEGDAYDGEGLSSVFRACHVADIGLRDGQVSCRSTVDGARHEQDRQAVGKRQQQKAEKGSGLTHDENGFPAETVGDLPENRA